MRTQIATYRRGAFPVIIYKTNIFCFSCLTNNDFDHDDGVKCNGDDSTVVAVESLLLPCGWYNPGGRTPLNEKGASGDDRHSHLQV